MPDDGFLLSAEGYFFLSVGFFALAGGRAGVIGVRLARAAGIVADDAGLAPKLICPCGPPVAGPKVYLPTGEPIRTGPVEYVRLLIDPRVVTA